MLEVFLLLVMVYLVLGLHELGHLMALRRYGVPVPLFALGGPPWVFRRSWRGTEYRLGLVPLAGFVAPDVSGVEALPKARYALVYLAGPLMNLAGALVGLLLLWALQGDVGVLAKGLVAMVSFPLLLVEGLWEFLAGTAPEGSTGFLAFFREGSRVVGLGLQGVVGLWVALNMVMGWFNLLPLPPLDGGQVVFGLLREWRLARSLGVWATWVGLGFVLVVLLWGVGYDLGILGR